MVHFRAMITIEHCYKSPSWKLNPLVSLLLLLLDCYSIFKWHLCLSLSFFSLFSCVCQPKINKYDDDDMATKMSTKLSLALLHSIVCYRCDWLFGVVRCDWLLSVWCAVIGCCQCDALWLAVISVVHCDWLLSVWCTVIGCYQCGALWLAVVGVVRCDWLLSVWCAVIGCYQCGALWLAVVSVVHCDWLLSVWCTVIGCCRCGALWLAVVSVVRCDWLLSVWCTVIGCCQCGGLWLAVISVVHCDWLLSVWSAVIGCYQCCALWLAVSAALDAVVNPNNDPVETRQAASTDVTRWQGQVMCYLHWTIAYGTHCLRSCGPILL